MKTVTLASLYEKQGYIREALAIYWDLLEKDPENRVALKALERLAKERRRFHNPHPKLTHYFVKMQSSESVKRFEEWLMKW